MILLCNLILTIIFLIISFFHFYWAFGGPIGKTESVPITDKGILLFKPGFLACFIVGLGFLIFIFLLYLPSLNLLPERLSKGLLWLLAIVFLMRVIGDFNYLGIFKKVKNTSFSKSDNRYFVPLCFLIMILIIAKILAM